LTDVIVVKRTVLPEP